MVNGFPSRNIAVIGMLLSTMLIIAACSSQGRSR
jgi:hypothetical protein